MIEFVVASAAAAVVAMLDWGWLLLRLFLRRVTAEIDAVRDSLVAKLDACECRLGGEMQRLEHRLEHRLASRMQRLEDGRDDLRLELARLEGILIGLGRSGNQWRTG